ncbi:MAG TPA: galactokinase [Acidimicrobiales bacterium]|nr:galactokinase [Acidimicrobiales bacterium]
MDEVRAVAPGRVNLIGDHTDHTGGLVLPMAVELATTVEGVRGGDRVVLRSDHDPDPAVVPLDVGDPAAVAPGWARYVAGVVAELRPPVGFEGTVSTTLPIGGGLSSSAALEVAVALALGADGADPRALARLAQRAEQRASGVPCGIMDQLASVAGRAGHALLIDCHSLDVVPVPLPARAEVVVVDSGQARALAGSAYAERAAQCRAAEAAIGPLRRAAPGAEAAIADPVVRARARHVLTENTRVRATAEALAAGDLALVGAAMAESHASLRDDFGVSTPVLDALVSRLAATPGVHGARLTGAGFGGCVVALADPGALAGWGPERSWSLRPGPGARCVPAIPPG